MQSVIVSTVKSCKKLQNDLLSFPALTVHSLICKMLASSPRGKKTVLQLLVVFGLQPALGKESASRTRIGK